MYLFVGSSEPTWLWPDDSNNFFNVQAVGVRWDHGKLWRFESHLQSLGCRACWRHSQNHSSFKFVKVCLNANFKFYFLVEFLHTIWYNCFIARTSIRMRMQRRRWPPIWKSTPPGKDWFKFVERPIGGVLPTKNGLFQCQLVFLSKLDTPIYAIDPDLGSLDGPEPWWLLIALSEADKTGDFSYSWKVVQLLAQSGTSPSPTGNVDSKARGGRNHCISLGRLGRIGNYSFMFLAPNKPRRRCFQLKSPSIDSTTCFLSFF